MIVLSDLTRGQKVHVTGLPHFEKSITGQLRRRFLRRLSLKLSGYPSVPQLRSDQTLCFRRKRAYNLRVTIETPRPCGASASSRARYQQNLKLQPPNKQY